MTIKFVKTFKQLREFSTAGIPALPETEWRRLCPDMHVVLSEGNELQARCSIWRSSFQFQGNNTRAAIGHFEAIDPASGVAILRAACDCLKEKGATEVVGPMNANTWNTYRLITYSSGRPPFVMEPSHPEHYVECWQQSGFAPCVQYYSTEGRADIEIDPRLERTIEKLRKAGVSVRNIRLEDYESELARIFKVASVAFEGNHYYTPITSEQFVELYLPYHNKLDADLIWIAEQCGEPVGFVFGLPDLLQAMRGEKIDTVVYKTIAALPCRELAGLGLYLRHLAYQSAQTKGFTRFINALITSQSKLSYKGDSSAVTFRKYTLFKSVL